MSSNPMRTPQTPSNTSLPGRLTMAVGRSLDPLLQYTLLHDGGAASILNSLGFWRTTPLPLVSTIGLGLGSKAGFELGLFSNPQVWLSRPGNVLLLGATISSLRHVYWSLFRCQSGFPVVAGFGVSTYNSLLSTINTLVLAYSLTHSSIPSESSWAQFVGLGLIVLGCGIEVASEESRLAFKKNPANKGSVDGTGLWGLVRHPNYLGYCLWRTGGALITGSYTLTAVTLLTQAGLFLGYSIPELEGHMKGRYGVGWVEYVKKVPSSLFPFLW